MGTQPEELRSDAENTRAHLARNVDLLAEKVTPRKVAHRKAEAAHHRLTGMKERVMGSTHDTKNDVVGTAHDVADTTSRTAEQIGGTVKDTAGQISGAVQQTPAQVKQRAQGNPIAAGVIAFGAGMLVAGLLPASKAEERVGAKLRTHSEELLQPVKQTATQTAQDVKEGMRQPADEAVESVRSTAQGAARTTKEEARNAAQDTTQELRGVGRDTAREVRDRTDRPGKPGK